MLLQGALGNSSILPSALACAQACFDAAAPFYYCPTQPFDNLEGGSSLEDCPPNKCDSWTYCGQKGASTADCDALLSALPLVHTRPALVQVACWAV